MAAKILKLCLFLWLPCITAGCGFSFTIPENGEKMSYEELSADEAGQFYLKLEDHCKRIDYKDFSIRREGMESLRLYIQRNAPEFAEWRSPEFIGKRAGNHELLCIAARNMLPPHLINQKMDVNFLALVCRQKYLNSGREIKNFTLKPILYQEKFDAVEYAFSMNLYGQDTRTHGILCLLPDQPGVILDISARQKISDSKNIPLYRDLGERFLQSVILD